MTKSHLNPSRKQLSQRFRRSVVAARSETEAANGYRHSPGVTIRWATPADGDRLHVLAELDEAPIPPAPLLLGLVGDELWVAVSLTTGTAISDPFRPTAEVTQLVNERGRQLTFSGMSRARRELRRIRDFPRLGYGH